MNSLNAAVNGISTPPSPQSSRAATVETMPMAANTRWPVSSISSMEPNMMMAMAS